MKFEPKDVPTTIEYEIEVGHVTYAYATEEGCWLVNENPDHLVEATHETVQFEVYVHLRLPQTGQIEILHETEFSPERKYMGANIALTKSNTLYDQLCRLFPDADHCAHGTY